MKITILVDDKAVYVDGRAMRITDLDWSKFFGDPSSKEDDIHAVQFNTERGQGHVEYKNYPTKQLGRPDVPTPDWCIDTAIFEREFAWVLPHYEAALSQAVAAEAAERAAEDEANAERIERGEAPAVQAAASADVEALYAELEAVRAQLLQTDTKLNDALVAAAKASEQQEGA